MKSKSFISGPLVVKWLPHLRLLQKSVPLVWWVEVLPYIPLGVLCAIRTRKKSVKISPRPPAPGRDCESLSSLPSKTDKQLSLSYPLLAHLSSRLSRVRVLVPLYFLVIVNCVLQSPPATGRRRRTSNTLETLLSTTYWKFRGQCVQSPSPKIWLVLRRRYWELARVLAALSMDNPLTMSLMLSIPGRLRFRTSN